MPLNNYEKALFNSINNNEDITPILEHGVINFNCQDDRGRTPIFFATENGHVDAINANSG